MANKKKKTEDGVPLLPDVSGKPDPGSCLDRSGFRITGMMWIIFIFIIILRLDTAMEARDIWCWVKRKSVSMEVSFTVIPPNYPHTTNSDIGTVSKWEYLFIDVEGFMKKFLDNPVKAEKVIQRIYSRALFFGREGESVYLEQRSCKIMDIMRDGEEFYLEEAKGSACSTSGRNCQVEQKIQKKTRLRKKAGKLTNMITRVLDYVSYHYMEDIKVEDLANICHISETHFRRVFTSYMKMSPLEYINTVRIYTACELLENTDEPVADIAHKCGFTTNSTFNQKLSNS